MGQTRGQKAAKESSSLLAFDILGMPEIQEWLDKSPERLREALRAAMHASVAHVKGKVQDKLDNDVLHRRSSPGLFGSVNTRVRQHQNRKAYFGVVGTHLLYARVHEFGATIRPRSRDGYLQFKIDGKWIRTKQVRIPKRPVWVPAFRESRERIITIHQQAINRMLREAGQTTARRGKFKAKTMDRFRRRSQ